MASAECHSCRSFDELEDRPRREREREQAEERERDEELWGGEGFRSFDELEDRQVHRTAHADQHGHPQSTDASFIVVMRIITELYAEVTAVRGAQASAAAEIGVLRSHAQQLEATMISIICTLQASFLGFAGVALQASFLGLNEIV